MQPKLTILLLLLCFALPCYALEYNENGDCIVNFLDFAILANGWGSTTDVNDIAGLADEWLEYEPSDPNRAPVIYNQSDILIAGDSQIYTIIATDDESLTYYINAVSEPNAGDVNGLTGYPYTLASNTFIFDSNASYEGTCKITYSADDGTGLNSPCGGVSYGYLNLTINQLPTPPVASDANEYALQYVRQTITLTATDDGYPNPPAKLKYIITSLPSEPNTLLQDPKSGSGIINSVPYTLNGGGSSVWYYADTVGVDSFQFQANDYGADPNTSGASNVATVNVNVIANPKDCLYFDGSGGTVTFPANSYFDLVSGQGIDFWVKTHKPFQGICKKRGGDGTGWELNLVHGKPQFELYDANGLVLKARSFIRLDNGNWNEVGFVFNHTVEGISIALNVGLGHDSCGIYVGGSFPEVYLYPAFNDPNVSYVNSGSLVFGSTSYGSYKGCIDKLRTFTGITDPTCYTALTQGLSPRTEDADEVVLGFGKASTVLYMFDEGTGTSLVATRPQGIDDGIIDSPTNVLWLPQLEVFNDASIKQFYKYMEKRKCLENVF